jgi:hypothetical protein
MISSPRMRRASAEPLIASSAAAWVCGSRTGGVVPYLRRQSGRPRHAVEGEAEHRGDGQIRVDRRVGTLELGVGRMLSLLTS